MIRSALLASTRYAGILVPAHYAAARCFAGMTSNKASVSCHVLDTSIGKPGKGMELILERADPDTTGKGIEHLTYTEMTRSVTNDDGRVTNLPEGLEPGVYRITFLTAQYFAPNTSFYPLARIEFTCEADEHYHIPLLVSPFGYTTYRGS